MRSRSRPYRRSFMALDAVVIALVAAGLVYLVYVVRSELIYRWDWEVIPTYLVRFDQKAGRWTSNLLLQGFLMTIKLAIWGILLASVVGTILGIMRTSRRPVLRWISRSYVELVRNMPPLVFVFIFYFFFTSQLLPLLGIGPALRKASPETQALLEFFLAGPVLIENFLAGLACLVLFTAAYITEIVRAGIENVPRAQYEAGESLGLTRLQVMHYIVLPQAVRRMLPALAGQFISCIKDSTLVSVVSVPELTFMTTDVSVTTSRVFEVWLFAGALYFILCFVCSSLARFVEVRFGQEAR